MSSLQPLPLRSFVVCDVQSLVPPSGHHYRISPVLNSSASSLSPEYQENRTGQRKLTEHEPPRIAVPAVPIVNPILGVISVSLYTCVGRIFY
ncbi:hypothetical protein J6590_084680 [Homalodisca vitripennis]|nr:hypothetical protein J6590_084680 [Homalodisca vitripennis]